MLSNKKRQVILNTDKYYKSQKYGNDLSGKMSWCIGCPKQNFHHSCSATQKEKDEKCLCAVNFNKFKKARQQ